ncbi:MAG: PAS domain S-box protein, partial [Chloroflexi bacterium]|nr:PAS domain S-box protein [Chloroflexota bacterium]
MAPTSAGIDTSASGQDEDIVLTEEGLATLERLSDRIRAAQRQLDRLNDELRATIEELDATNDDLEARSVELQEAALRLELERHASKSERSRLTAVIESMSDGVAVLARDGSALVRNQAYADLIGADSDGRMDDENGRPLGPSETLEARASQGEEFRLVVTRPGAGGSRRWFEAVSRRVAAAGSRESTVLVIRDITDRSLRRTQDEFIATASHELRTPLAVLTGYLHLIERTADGAVGEHTRRALEHAQQLEGLIGDLLDITRLETGQMRYELEPIELGALVHEAVEAAAVLAGEQLIHFRRPGTVSLVDGDRQRILQVLRNLLDNARVHASSSGEIRVRLRRRGGWAEVAVQDDGPGIAGGDLERLFERFQRASSPTDPGLGLGLHIAREIVRGHHGTLTATSQLGRGSTFSMRLPLRA